LGSTVEELNCFFRGGTQAAQLVGHEMTLP
jgi:hypothetical protein